MMRRSPLTLVVVAWLVVVTAVAAHAAAGGLDPTFSGDGKLTTNFGGPEQGAEALVVQPDGRIVVAGSRVNDGGDSAFAVARYLTTGALDTTFSGDGRAVAVFPEGPSEANDIALTASGQLVVVGNVGEFLTDFGVARFNANGTLDTSFSGDGRRIISFGGDLDSASGVVVTPGGKIVVSGSSLIFGPGGGSIALARLTASGALDTSFSGDGKLLTQVTDSSDGNDIALVDGKLVVVGTGMVSDHQRYLVVQYTGAGALDPAFGGGDGWLTTRFGTHPDGTSGAFGIEVDANGRLVVAGEANLGLAGSDGDFAVARYLPNGALDTSFSSDGKVTHDFGGYENAEDLALQPDGKIALAGVSVDANQFQAVARLNPNGSRDLTFSGDGFRTVDFSATHDFEGAQDIKIVDGKLVAVGYGFTEGSAIFTVMRLQGS